MGNKNSGRKSRYTEAIADELFERLADGQSLYRICKDEDMPAEPTVRAWVIDDKPKGFSAKYARARDMGLDKKADQLLERGDNCPPDTAYVAKERLYSDNLKWYLSKLAPKKYGDKIQNEQSGTITVVIDKADEGNL